MTAPMRFLRWMYAGRLALAAGIFAGVLLAWSRTSPETTRVGTLMFVVTLVVAGASAWWTQVRQRSPGPVFLYGQVLYDALLVTVAVHLTGGWESVFAPLYVLVIVSGALLLPWPGGVVVGALAIGVYAGEIFWIHPSEPPALVFLQLVVFGLVALVTGYLGDRLRRTDTALDEVASELKRLKLDTDDLLGTIETGVLTVDDAGRLVYLNPAGETVLRLRRREWLGRPVLGELKRRSPGLVAAIERTAERGGPVRRAEARARFGDVEAVLGVRTTVLERSPTGDPELAEGAESGRRPWITAVFQDITDGKRLEELNRRTERLEAVAELAASLAHEIKNPLASIRSAVEQLVGSKLQAEDREVLERLVRTESDRLTRLLGEFLEFSRVEVKRSERIDLTELVPVAVELVRQHPDGGRECRVDVHVPGSPVAIEGDEDLIHRAVFNLVLNAVQHAGPDGRVLVELEPVREMGMPAGIALGDAALLTVTDNGPGVPDGDRARVFDPFFTTRPGGSGLGLALVHRAVKAHGGAILLDDAAPGARFTVYLPLRSPATTPAVPAGARR